MFPVAVLPASRYPQSPIPAAYPVLARSPVSRLLALLPLTVISLSDGHSLVNVLHGTKLPRAIIISTFTWQTQYLCSTM